MKKKKCICEIDDKNLFDGTFCQKCKKITITKTAAKDKEVKKILNVIAAIFNK